MLIAWIILGDHRSGSWVWIMELDHRQSNGVMWWHPTSCGTFPC